MTKWNKMTRDKILDGTKAAIEFKIAGALWGLQHRTDTTGCFCA